MPPGGFGAGSKEGPPILARSFGTDVTRVKQTGATAKTTPNSEHKVMDAAQHLVSFDLCFFQVLFFVTIIFPKQFPNIHFLSPGILETRLTAATPCSAPN
jgi:hypothetical protein